MDYHNFGFYNYWSGYSYKEQGDNGDKKDSKEQKDNNHQNREKKDYEEQYYNQSNIDVNCYDQQRHVHELLGSVQIADWEEPHNHHFMTVTGEAIPCGHHDHVHEVFFRTDFYENHFHEFKGRTGGAIKVGDRHVHFIKDITSVNDGHRHKFRAATLIEDPIADECKGHK